jgi:hypothetical protein
MGRRVSFATLGGVAVAATLLALVPTEAQSAPARATVARARLAPPENAARRRARGRIVERILPGDARQVLTFGLSGLRRGVYTLLCDDPATEDPTAIAIAEVRTNRGGAATLRIDTGRGDALPFGESLRDLAGARVELRDADGRLILSGEMPSSASRTTTLKAGSLLIDDPVAVFADNFDADPVGAPPTGWDVTGTEVVGVAVVVDDTVKDGATGASVRLDDAVAADPGAPSMSHGFTAQTGFFTVGFTLISGAGPARVVANVGDDSGGTNVFGTGFGEGLGLYENGTIGFGPADTIQTSTPSTTYHFLVEFDLAAKKFDVSIDGVKVVTGRDLGFAGTSLDRITFSGSALTTGTAWVDTVSVVHRTQDFAPTANAGPDQVVECAGAGTAVTLNGSASTDPENATLTFTWTGPFVESTATGATPTVHFNHTGSFVVTLVVNDGLQNSDPDTVLIEVQDTLPPVLTVTGLPTRLWPPNHQLVAMTPTVSAIDACDGDVTARLTLVATSSQPDDGLGDGNTTGDIVVRSPSDFDLRAERSGKDRAGRTYTLVWSVTDDAGNTATFTTTVTTPHDMGHGAGGPPAGDDDDADDDDHGDDGAPPTTTPPTTTPPATHAGGKGRGKHKGHGKRHGR